MGNICQHGREQLCNVSLLGTQGQLVLWNGPARELNRMTVTHRQWNRHPFVCLWQRKSTHMCIIFLVCLVCHPTKTNKSCISRESDLQAGEAGKQADRKWKREWQAINGNKGGTIALSNGCLHQNSRLPLNFTLDFPLKINSTFISEKILYVELNEECFKDEMNPPLTLLCLPSPVFETVNRISWLGVLEV